MFRRTIVRQFDWFFFGLLFCLLVLTLPSNGETSGRDAQAAAGASSSESANNTRGDQTMSAVSVRYFVNDVDASIRFYTEQLGFDLTMRPGPGFAIVSRGDLRLLLSATRGPGGAAQAMPDGRRPEPGGWNRIQLQENDLDATVAELKKAGAHFRNDIVTGFSGKQILLEDPSGDPIELFQPVQRRG